MVNKKRKTGNRIRVLCEIKKLSDTKILCANCINKDKDILLNPCSICIVKNFNQFKRK